LVIGDGSLEKTIGQRAELAGQSETTTNQLRATSNQR
jgi:hypothetical protein